MRYLNRIVFINSAAIPYAEILLDGNIHFIGTQGVGKSTILRAILYFYNADTRHLGMPKGPTSKNFTEWYLAYANSYIVYEVARETGAYCVLAFKSQNRVCFRFIDTAYLPKYFMNDAGEVFANWERIRERLDADRVNVTGMVTSYEEYRDILYGNFTGKAEFRKYALLEAKQYNTIYRTIQNVFLNTKLDAAEIKQTIISSMDVDDICVDLEKYSHHLKDFETELKDIKQFSQASVLRNAEQAILTLSAIRHLKRELQQVCAQLVWRMEYLQTEKPKLLEEFDFMQLSAKAWRDKQMYEIQIFGKRKDRIVEITSQLNGKLQDSAKRKLAYEKQQISVLIRRVAANENIKLELKSLLDEKDIHTQHFGDISKRFKALTDACENQLAAFIHQKETQRLQLQQRKFQFELALNAEYDKLFAQIEAEQEFELEAKVAAYESSTDRVHSIDKQLLNLKHERFYAAEIAQKSRAVSDLELALHKGVNLIENYVQQIANLQAKWELEKKDAELQHHAELESLETTLKLDLEKKEQLIERIEKSADSLMAWLGTHKTGWEQTIGKVIDENLLFKSGLSPKLLTDAQSLYGLKIDLNEIDKSVKTIDDYRFELKNIEEQISTKQLINRDLRNEFDKNLERIQQRNLPKIKALKEQRRQTEYANEQHSRTIEKTKLELSALAEKAEADKKLALEHIQQELDKAKAAKLDAMGAQDGVKNLIKRKKEAKLREKSKRTNEFEREIKDLIDDLDSNILAKKDQVSNQIAQLTTQRNAELAHKGVDIQRLAEIEKLVFSLEAELQFIENNRHLVSEFNKDKRELFDKEKEFKNLVQLEEEKLAGLQNAFDSTMRLLTESLQQCELKIRSINEMRLKFDEDQLEYEQFKLSEAYRACDTFLSVELGKESKLSALRIIGEIKEKYYQQKDKELELRIYIDKFLGHFSEHNIFKFPSKLNDTPAYIAWAQDLNDFQEEGKIKQFEKRTNERFASIIGSVGKETTMLISKTGDIKKIINKINADFKQKNFVTAVNNIELDVTESKNTAVLLLKKIKEFNDENAMSLGVANLFSTVDHGKSNEKAVELLKQLIKELAVAKNSVVELSDSFELSFRVEENGNDTGWVEKLSNVGSEGTDVLVKAMINIMLLNVFKEGASRRFKDFKLHCMMDEIGKLHPTNVKGILKFANDRNILLINGSPTENTPLDYRHIYKIHKDAQKQSQVKRIISNTTLG